MLTKHHTFCILAFIALFSLSSVGFANGDTDGTTTTNSVDDNGLKQGYWVVKGYMTDDVNYGRNDVVSEGSYVDNRKEGLWKKYSFAGKLRSEIFYVHNRPEGKYTIYYPNGQVEESGSWVQNKNTGSFRRFYANGNPQQKFEFSDNGKRNGLQQYFHENGQLELEINIVNGKEQGLMSRYYEDGELKEEKTLTEGNLDSGSIKRFQHPSEIADAVETPSALVKVPAPLVDIPEDAPTTQKAVDEPNGAHNFLPNGYNILYNHSRQVTQIGDFRNGRLWNGKWHRYNSDGILVRIEIYKTGRYVGTGVIEDDDRK